MYSNPPSEGEWGLFLFGRFRGPGEGETSDFTQRLPRGWNCGS